MLPLEIQNEIISGLKTDSEVDRIILFGSHATENASDESDIDLIVILNKKGFPQSYSERINNRIRLSEKIINVRKKMAVDLLVYTADEWNTARRTQNDFMRNVQEQGVVLL